MKKLILVISLIFISGVKGQELVTLTTPIAKPSTSSCNLDVITLDMTKSTVIVNLVCNNQERISKQYDSFSSPTGATLLHNLNTANFTVNSFTKAVYNRLINDGVITGVVSGIPQ